MDFTVNRRKQALRARAETRAESLQPVHKAVYLEGFEAAACGQTENDCPYTSDQLTKRCGWLAGFRDTK